MVLIVDDGWSAAAHWSERQAALTQYVAQAEREGRRVVLLGTAPPAGDGAAPPLSVLRPEDARAAAAAMTPHPWPVDRKAALARLRDLHLESGVAVWLSDGLEDGTGYDFAEEVQHLGSLKVVMDGTEALPKLLGSGDPAARDLSVTVRRAGSAEEHLTVRAIGEDGRLLAREEAHLMPGDAQQTVALKMPVELRNQAAAVVIEGEDSAGATLLLDERWRRRPVGIAAPPAGEAAQPLLSGAFYIERALQPFSEVRRGGIAQLLQQDLAVLVLPDATTLDATERESIGKWLNAGGLVLRFAGPKLAEAGDDDLLPVALRRGGRVLGGALSWEKPAHLARFADDSPFSGLAIPDDVTVTRQVLAEPSLDLSGKTWARLTDGTPLVTAEKRGKGWLVLVHTTADPEWSNLAISGLFVDMLRRVVNMSEGVTSQSSEALPPVETLDGFGRLGPAPATAQLIPAGGFADARVDARHPPGYYGTRDARRALNLASSVPTLAPLTRLPNGVALARYERGKEMDFRPWLLGFALGLALIDLIIAYALRGLLSGIGRRRRAGTAAAGAIALVLLLPASPARAGNDDDAIRATSDFHLAYVRTGVPDVDEESRAGLTGLADILNRRTAVEAAQPIEVNVESDELVFFPLLYWPVVQGQQLPSAQAIDKINHYLATGGTILFDTRDQEQRTAISAYDTQQRLQRLMAGIKVPPLEPVPPDHVLTKAFYLMQDFPGRYAGGRLWIEPSEGKVNDGVASIIVGSNDYAGAWAEDDSGRSLYAVIPGGDEQREQAFRFGINLVMYTLTGNYKTDQVHVPAILERLGQ